MILKPVAVGLPVWLATFGVAMSRYLPGVSLLPRMRPLKRKLLLPVRPARLKPPCCVSVRVHV
jgi:hypothetical protein